MFSDGKKYITPVRYKRAWRSGRGGSLRPSPYGAVWRRLARSRRARGRAVRPRDCGKLAGAARLAKEAYKRDVMYGRGVWQRPI